MRNKPWIRCLVFLLVLALAVSGVMGIFKVNTHRSYENIYRFRKQEKGSLDGVYIGGSEVHAFWQPLLGWADRGIAVWNYSVDSLSGEGVLPLLTEARRTQPQALFLISLNCYKKGSARLDLAAAHRILDYMPFSANKLRLIRELTGGGQFEEADKLEFYFPFIRFHSGWDSLEPWSFGLIGTDFLSSIGTTTFVTKADGEVEPIVPVAERAELPADVESAITALLDYCDENRVNVLFVKLPQSIAEGRRKRLNTLEDMVTARGYPCLDLYEHLEEVGIRVDTDFYNEDHTNVHGSLKVTGYIGDYLAEHYGFEDKKGAAGWERWDRSAADYAAYIRPYTLPLERDHSPRDYSLPAPEVTASAGDGGVTVSWSASPGAEGYEIFRKAPKEADAAWYPAGAADGAAEEFTDTDVKDPGRYDYTVVPFREEDGVRVYGCFSARGASVGKEGK